MNTVRLNKHLAHIVGISRREADEWIARGDVIVNGNIATLGTTIDPEDDRVIAKGTTLSNTPHQYQYILMNKPVGYVCSRKKQGDAPTIYELLPKKYHHLKVAGRLDKDSCGLLLLTDDGNMILQLTHPRFGKEKVYHAHLDTPLKESDRKKIEQGIALEDGSSSFRITTNQATQPTTYVITISEGRNRQIRRTFKALGYIVTHLERVQFGTYSLSKLKDATYLPI